MTNDEKVQALRPCIESMGRECPSIGEEKILCKDCPINEACGFPNIKNIRDVEKMNAAYELRHKLTSPY